MIGRRQFLIALSALGSATVLAQPRPAKIGLLLAVPPTQSMFAPIVIQRLAQLGYQDGKGAVLVYRSADGAPEKFPRLARELIEAKCDVIFAIGSEQAVVALHAQRAVVPVVFFANDYDPMKAHVIASLARPGGNTTGVYVPEPEMIAKRFQIIREALPAARRVLVFCDPFNKEQLGAAREAAKAAAFALTVVEFTKPPYDLLEPLESSSKIDALMVLTSPVLLAQIEALRRPLAKRRMASIGTNIYADRGLLFGFGAVTTQALRRTAEMGVTILKGAKPSSIPVEQPREFEFVVNTKAAAELGIRIPQAVMARATRIIQ
jgi:putative ABC transport system substrate-binding protein